MKRNCKYCKFCFPITPELINTLKHHFFSTTTSFETPEHLEKFLFNYRYICMIFDGIFPAINSSDEFDCPVAISSMVFMTDEGCRENAKDCECFIPKDK